MSLLARLFHPPYPTATHRAYSSFFSSRSGGRYFNSARPPKTIVAASKDGEGGGGHKPNGRGSGASNNVKVKPDDKSSTVQPGVSTHEPAPQSPSTASTKPTVVQTHSIPSPPFNNQHSPILPVHPAVEPHDYKLHHFFSLHRPLLMLSQPASSIFESPAPSHPLFPSAYSEVPPPPANLETFDDPPEASAEADADAARQLARALVMSRVGGTVSWEAALKRLGLDVDEGRIDQVKDLAREWEEVHLDSTKRKRRKKMKKHKLRKRRKLQRATRLKIGR